MRIGVRNGSQLVPAGMPFGVVWAIDSILWASRDRFAGIPDRRGYPWEQFRRFGDDFGVKKGTQSGLRGSTKLDFEVRNCFFKTF